MAQDSDGRKPPWGMEIPLLDILRGIAASSVVFYHAAEAMVRNEPGLGNHLFYRAMGWGYLGVEVFFVVSGYCILVAAVNGIERGKAVGDFIGARLRRIFPPYWLSLAVTVLVWMTTTFLASRGILPTAQNTGGMVAFLTIPVIVTNLTLTQLAAKQSFVSVVAWTLCYEVAFYAITAILLLVAGSAKNRALILLRCTHSVTGIVLLMQCVLPGRLAYPLDMWAMFGLGAVLCHVVRAERIAVQERMEAHLWWGVLTLLTLGAIWRGPETTVSNHNHSVPVAFAAALVAAGGLWIVRNTSAKASGKTGQWLAVVGGFSYSLYLIHFLFIGFAEKMFHLLKLPTTWHYVQFFMIVGVSFVVGFVFFLVAEKPFLRIKSRRVVEVGKTPVAEVVP